MRLLLKSAFGNPRCRWLCVVTIVAMCLMTFANYLEILAIGIMTKKGPEFFQVVEPKAGAKSIDYTEYEAAWKEMDASGTGVVTREEIEQYIKKKNSNDFISRVIQTVDKVLPVSGNIKNLALMIVLVALFKAGLMFLHRFSTRLVAITISADLRLKFFEHMQSLPMSFYQKHNMGALSSRVVGDASSVAEAVNACMVNYLQTPFTVISSSIFCFLTSWRLSLIVFIGFPLIIFAISFLSKRVKRISKQILQSQEKFASVIIDFLSGVQTVKVYNIERYSLEKYTEQNRKMVQLEKRSARYDMSSRPVVHTIGMLFLATALIYGLYVLDMNVTEVLIYCGLLYAFYEPIKKFAEENSHIQRGIVAAERMHEVLELQPEISDCEDAVELTSFNHTIEFDDVWFKYEGVWVLEGLSFTIQKGETVAIVGPTGAGKSTIVQLLARLYEVQKGEIRIDGIPIHKITQRSLRELMGFVPQKPFLFLDTVANNITLGREYGEQEVRQAAKRAHAEEFIERMPHNYQTELAEAGKNLSGGQQQRLAIARALVKRAPILIMDEATSSLDNVSENNIKRAVRELKGQVTQILIAHRLSTIEDADKIIYLERGVKVAEGPKEMLLRTCVAFRNMYELGAGVEGGLVNAGLACTPKNAEAQRRGDAEGAP